MKVLFISTADYKYGAAKTQIDMIMELKNKHEVVPIVLTKKHNAVNDFCNNKGIENYSYWYRDIMSGSAYSNPILNIAKHIVKYFLYILGALTQRGVLKCGIKWDEVDVIHTNHIRVDIGAYISKKTGIPHIWHIKELNHGHVKIIHYKTNCYKYINNSADEFIAVTNQVKTYWCQAGIDKKKVSVIYEGIDCDKFEPQTEANSKSLRIVCVGRIEKSKGQLHILQAISQIPKSIQENIIIDFIGEPYPDYLHQLQKYIRNNDMEDRVNFCGYCDDIPKALRNYDVGILSSKGDAFGTVTAEYMAAGLVAIATYTELVDHMETGLRYEFGDIDGLCENILFVYENREKALELSRAGLKRIKDEFSIGQNAQQVYELYLKMYELRK